MAKIKKWQTAKVYLIFPADDPSSEDVLWTVKCNFL